MRGGSNERSVDSKTSREGAPRLREIVLRSTGHSHLSRSLAIATPKLARGRR